MGVRMNVPYDNGTAKLAAKQEYHLFPKTLEDKLIRTGLAEFAPSPRDLEALVEIDEQPAPSMAMTKAELLAMAEERGVPVETDDNKADLVRKIEAAG